ncbi:MAG TPA: G5 domain-containing protein [Patescibacteria group bacterium]|nr:G5 domain-containing protein [Patescibacteria group bacterium]
MKRFKLWPAGLSTTGNVLIGLGIAATVGLFGLAAAQPKSLENTSQKNPSQLTPTSQPSVKADTTEIKQVSETEVAPFSTTTQNDGAIPKGQTKVTQTGQNGVKTRIYSVTYTNGQETNRELISENVTTPPVDQIVHNGTYVAQVSCSGGYINVDGNCIPSPSSNPAGATAQCGDGTYSYSQHRSGTCSHHGGVARWL